METHTIKLSKIKPNPSNPRLIKDDKFAKLVQSLRDFPEMADIRPIVVNKDMVILGGNMRFKAMKEAGWKECPVVVADLTEEQEREFIIKDNVGFGDWDFSMLANEWNADDLTNWGVDLPEFEGVQVKAEEDDYEIPKEIKTEIVLGDLIEIGHHRLLCGDSTLPETFEKLMNGNMADMVITDPPYNVDYTGGTKDALKIQNDKLSDDEFYQFLLKFYTALAQYTKPGGVWYVWHSDSEGENFRAAMKNAGLMFKQCLIWVKNSLVMGRQDYQWKHEPCLYGWKPGASHLWYSDRKQTTVLEFDRPVRNAEHPTMKPVPLFGYLIRNSSRRGQIIVDAFAGSGTTVVTCHQMDRTAYVAENDPKYCQVIVDRMIKLDSTLIIKRNGKPYGTT